MPVFLIEAIDPHNEFASRIMETSSVVRGILRPWSNVARSRPLSAMRADGGVFHGWRAVAVCFVVASFAWGLGLFGSSVYLQAVTAAHGWAVAEVASAITLFFLVSAAVQRVVGRSIDRWGPRPVLTFGTVSIASGVALIGQVSAPWQLYPCFVLVGIGWSALSTTGIPETVAPGSCVTRAGRSRP